MSYLKDSKMVHAIATGKSKPMDKPKALPDSLISAFAREIREACEKHGVDRKRTMELIEFVNECREDVRKRKAKS